MNEQVVIDYDDRRWGVLVRDHKLRAEIEAAAKSIGSQRISMWLPRDELLTAILSNAAVIAAIRSVLPDAMQVIREADAAMFREEAAQAQARADELNRKADAILAGDDTVTQIPEQALQTIREQWNATAGGP